jgi:hypothetical protein
MWWTQHSAFSCVLSSHMNTVASQRAAAAQPADMPGSVNQRRHGTGAPPTACTEAASHHSAGVWLLLSRRLHSSQATACMAAPSTGEAVAAACCDCAPIPERRAVHAGRCAVCMGRAVREAGKHGAPDPTPARAAPSGVVCDSCSPPTTTACTQLEECWKSVTCGCFQGRSGGPHGALDGGM